MVRAIEALNPASDLKSFVNAMEGKPPPLGALLRQVQNDIRATARVDAAGSTDRLQSGHAAALTLLLRDAVLKRDWSRAAGAHTQYDSPRASRTHLPCLAQRSRLQAWWPVRQP